MNKTTWVETIKEQVWKEYQQVLGVPEAYETGTLCINPEDAVALTTSLLVSELQLQRREWIEMIKGMKKELTKVGCPIDGYYLLLDDIIKKVGNK